MFEAQPCGWQLGFAVVVVTHERKAIRLFLVPLRQLRRGFKALHVA